MGDSCNVGLCWFGQHAVDEIPAKRRKDDRNIVPDALSIGPDILVSDLLHVLSKSGNWVLCISNVGGLGDPFLT